MWNRVRQLDWLLESDVEDLLSGMDPRLDYLRFGELSQVLGHEFRPIFSRSKYRTAEQTSLHRISLNDTVALTILLEACGFLVDPEPMVRELEPSIARKTLLTSSELVILRYRHDRKRRTVVFTAPRRRRAGDRDQQATDADLTQDQFKTAGRYQVSVDLVDGAPIILRIIGPRRPLPREQVHCEYCDFNYVRGDPEESLEHRKLHRWWQSLREPKPLKPMLDRIASDPNPELVRSSAPIWFHRQMYERSLAFKREMGFDGTQWGYERDTDPTVHGFLMTIEGGAIAGACCFRRDGERWSLFWIWIAPQYRRSGIVSRRWSAFVASFGDFSIEPPISPAMQAFVLECGSARQKEEMRNYQQRLRTA
jgi:hypothetical protein